MRKWSIILLLTSLWLIGCQEQSPVELVLDNPDQLLEATKLVNIDSKIILDSSVDTTGVLNNEARDYIATLLVNGVKSDLGAERESFSFSRILMFRKNREINDSYVSDFQGMQMDVAALNRGGSEQLALPELKRPYRTKEISIPGMFCGYMYDLLEQDYGRAGKTVYNPEGKFSFMAKGRYTASTIAEEITTPDEITIVQPRSNTVALRRENLTVRWNGKPGEAFQVVMSVYNPKSRPSVKPVMKIQLQSGANSITIPAKALQALEPSQENRYMFSFISSNQKIAAFDDGNLSGNVLVQASSIHNIILWLK